MSGAPGTITVRELLDFKRDRLQLELLTAEAGLDRQIEDSDISSPGLALAGFTERVPSGRTQVFGETEMSYLGTLEAEAQRERLEGLFAFPIPAVFVTKGQEVPPHFLEAAAAAEIPVLRTGLSTKDFFQRIKPFLEGALAPRTNLHGSLADVYGVGLLFVGPSGVGKSECVLDLVERGHRLVADDLVITKRVSDDILLGRGHELQGHHMEIRGIGIVDIKSLFGIRAIRQQKRIEVVVQLEHWDEDRHYDRTGLDADFEEILGVQIPRVIIPLNPGKNITVLSEVVAMNHLMRYSGVDPAKAFDKHLREAIQLREYLEADYE